MKLEIFDPAMCCSTGICGPSVDERLVRIKENIEILKGKYEELEIHRYMISTHPLKFRTNRDVFALVKEKGKNALPITTLNGKIVAHGDYLTLDEMQKLIEGEKSEN